MRENQKNIFGFSVIDFILVLLVVLTLVVPVARIFPTYIEYYGIKKTIQRVQQTAQNEKEARTEINNQFIIDSIKTINADNIVIEQVNDKLKMSFSYKQEIPLYGDLSLLMNYKAETK
jgi:hypothetical protein